MCCNVSKNGVSKKVGTKSKDMDLWGPNGAFLGSKQDGGPNRTFMFPQLHVPFLGYLP